jgi:hypothetical protein
MIGISLNQNISCEQICKTIQNLVNNYKKQNNLSENSMLTIRIVETQDSKLIEKVLYLEKH